MKYITTLSFLLFAGFSNVFGLICWECENAYGGGQRECLRTGHPQLCRKDQEFCELHLRHGGDGRNRPFVAKSCKTRKACADNAIQNSRKAWARRGEQIQCNENFPSSVCRCCCSGDLCNQNLTSCQVVYGCPPLKDVKGANRMCTNGFGFSSRCTYECRNPTFKKLLGAPSIFCNVFGKWSHPQPKCEKIRCHPIPDIEHGSSTCSKGNQYKSKCSFACDQGYRLQPPAPTITCIPDQDDDEFGLWSRQVPRCIPLQCRRQVHVNHGTLRCTDKNFVGSSCSLTCDEGYELFPSKGPHTVTCMTNEKWSANTSCCTLPCPPNAIMDFVVILDSSSSVGDANWVKVKNFTRNFISQFTIRDDTTHVAVIRYNNQVDRKNQIFFNSFPNDKAGLLRAFDAIPYNGEGTRTGNAISYVVNTILRRGNRELARDIVLLITDGKSTDQISIPARRLRRTGASVFVLPIQASAGDIDLKEIDAIAGGRQNVLTQALTQGFDALNEEFSEEITDRVCTQPCFNPFHNHPDEALPDHDHP